MFFSCQIPCPAGFKCERGRLDPAPVQCQEGFYQPYTGREDCIPCPAGKFCPFDPNTPLSDVSDSSYDIAIGYFSIAGAETSTPLSLSGVRGICEDGFECDTRQDKPQSCPEGTASYSAGECSDCQSGFFCPRRAIKGTETNNYPCEDGYSCESRCTSSNPVGGSDCKLCPEGSKCESGTASECEANQYQPSQEKDFLLLSKARNFAKCCLFKTNQKI